MFCAEAAKRFINHSVPEPHHRRHFLQGRRSVETEGPQRQALENGFTHANF